MAKQLESWISEDVGPFKDKPLSWLSSQHFFRDPVRPSYSSADYFFAPADGVVLYQEEVGPSDSIVDIKGKPYSLREALRDPGYDKPSLVIGIFMTFFDVHINRVPYPGRLSYRQLEPIDTLNHPMLEIESGILEDLRVAPSRAEYLRHNQRMVNRIETTAFADPYYVLQIADYDVDSITPFELKQNQPCFQGQRFSQIRYGSQVDLIIPLSGRRELVPTQTVHSHVEAGVDTLVAIRQRKPPADTADDPEGFMSVPDSVVDGRAAPRTEPSGRPRTPSELQRPAFLLNFPFSYSTEVANNAWMTDIADEERSPDPRRAMTQFLGLYSFLASEGLVYLLPTPGGESLQDLVFTANLGVVLGHLDPSPVLISNFTSEPRRGESQVGRSFFESMGYEVLSTPHRFEGEADLKHLHDNVYVGGYGLRSERESYEWMEREFDMEIVKVRETDPYLYHLDCTVFPLTREDTLVCTEMFESEEVAEIERHTNVIDVGVDECYSGICNSVRLSNTILNGSSLHDLRAGSEDHRYEVKKNRRLEDIAIEHAMEVAYFDLGEYMKGGALLSCMVMHLNRYSYAFRLV